MSNFSALNKKQGSRFKEMTLLFVVCVGIIVFSMGIVRGRCISKGYDLSSMATEIEQRRIRIEKSETARSAMVSKETLFPLAADKGFILMQEGKTFNVQR